MNFGYEGIKNSEIIKHYTNENNYKIIVEYLDGSKYTIPKYTITEDMEEIVQRVMLKQAEERNNSTALNVALKNKKDSLFCTIANSSCIIALLLSAYYSGNLPVVALSSIGMGVNYIAVCINGKKYNLSKKEIDEIKKYSIYLSIKDKISEYKDNPNLYNDIDKKADININTIDDYSLLDLIKVQRNILKIEKFNRKILNKTASMRKA